MVHPSPTTIFFTNELQYFKIKMKLNQMHSDSTPSTPELKLASIHATITMCDELYDIKLQLDFDVNI